jgi:hypothetical protein
MVQRVKRVFFGWPSTLILCVWIGYLGYLQLLPPSHWLEVRKISVFDTIEGETPKLDVDRTIRRPFFGYWTLSVREVTPNGITQVCEADGKSRYRLDAALPDPITLDWWSTGQCSVIERGQYIVTTTWRWSVGFLGLTFNKEVNVDSNPFRVLPNTEAARSLYK